MSEKQTKKLRRMARLFYASQPMPVKSVDDIFKILQKAPKPKSPISQGQKIEQNKK